MRQAGFNLSTLLQMRQAGSRWQYLGPNDAMENTPQPPKSAKLETPKPMPKVAKLKAPKVMPKAKVAAQLPADREFVPPRRRGLFGLFFSRRF
jgi:hypothetical protein